MWRARLKFPAVCARGSIQGDMCLKFHAAAVMSQGMTNDEISLSVYNIIYLFIIFFFAGIVS